MNDYLNPGGASCCHPRGSETFSAAGERWDNREVELISQCCMLSCVAVKLNLQN
jgi:hypothetical protein